MGKMGFCLKFLALCMKFYNMRAIVQAWFLKKAEDVSLLFWRRWSGVGLLVALALVIVACERRQQSSDVPAPSELPPERPAPSDVADRIRLESVAYEEIEGWREDSLEAAFPALVQSCIYLSSLPSDRIIGPGVYGLTAGAFDVFCLRLTDLTAPDEQEMRAFLMDALSPYRVFVPSRQEAGKETDIGLITGYYESELAASPVQSAAYPHPIFGIPDDLVSVDLSHFKQGLGGGRLIGRAVNGKLVPYHTRYDIMQNRLSDRPLLYAADALDLFILHVQGSGRATLPDGQVVQLRYAGNNGHDYRSIARVLIDKGILTWEQAGWQHIRAWMQQNPDQALALLATNPRYIFFSQHAAKPGEELPAPYGAFGRPLTNQRSLAVDPSRIPLGIPIWLDTSWPGPENRPLRRLMAAQDTGNAIKGTLRGDFFWGYGKEAAALAGSMKNEGRYILLLPREYTPPDEVTGPLVPLVAEQ